ncbi:MAG: allantoinase AllB [Candidatus Sericytochromatia bacterium]
MSEVRLFSQRVILPEGLQPASVVVRNGRIAEIAPGVQLPDCEDLGEQVLMAGLVDPHVHVNEPGRTAWEGFATATRAAAAGGVTSLVDMPLNSDPVTTTRDAFAQKREAARGQCWIDTGFWGGVIPGNADELEGMIADGIRGFKAFLIHSGIDDFPHSSEADLRLAMPILARHGLPLLAHAELEGEAPAHPEQQPQSYSAFLQSRPKDWEDRAIALMIQLCRETGCPTHIVHLSSATALPMIAAAKAEGLPFTVETCPHYLFFEAEQIPDGHPEYKCMPPIRESDNQAALWQGLREGVIDCVVTDHSPCTPGLKLLDDGDVLHAWGGIASLQFGLSSVWTRARERGFGPVELARWMSEAPAHLAGLGARKGRLAVGYDADLVVWQPEASFAVHPDQIHFRHPVTPYAAQTLFGVVARTYLRGDVVYADGQHVSDVSGHFLLRD